MDDDETNNWALEKIMMPDAWDYTRGSAAITVGIIDSGIDASHPDLDEQVNVNLSRAFFGTTGPLVDENGHGTAIAGIIGAEAIIRETPRSGQFPSTPAHAAATYPIPRRPIIDTTDWGEKTIWGPSRIRLGPFLFLNIRSIQSHFFTQSCERNSNSMSLCPLSPS